MIRLHRHPVTAGTESSATEVARPVAFEQAVRIGPAAAVAVGGFLQGIVRGHIRSGDRVMQAIGEGMRRAPELMLKMAWSTRVKRAADCSVFGRRAYGESIRARLEAALEED